MNQQLKNRLILYYNVMATVMNKSRQLSIRFYLSSDDSRQVIDLTPRRHRSGKNVFLRRRPLFLRC